MQRILKNTAFASVVLSLLFHFVIGTGLGFVQSATKQPKQDLVEILLLPSDANKNPQQIVEQDKKQLNEEVPDKTKFLGRHNQKVVKETRAAETGEYNNSAGKGQNAQSQGQGRKAQPSPQVTGTLPSLKELSPTYNKQYDPNKNNSTPGQTSQTNDYLKDVNKGLQTLLSTREFVYYSYYERIRGKIRQYWEPSIREKVRKIFAQGRTLASSRDRITKVMIVLNGSGHLIKVQVLGESGVKDLDDAAIEAFRAAEPFPNPPQGIVEPDGTIKIRWDFVLEAMNHYTPIEVQPVFV